MSAHQGLVYLIFSWSVHQRLVYQLQSICPWKTCFSARICLSITVILYLGFYLSEHLVYLSYSMSVHQGLVYLSFSMSVHQGLVYLSFSSSAHQGTWLSASVCLSIKHLFICFSLSVHQALVYQLQLVCPSRTCLSASVCPSSTCLSASVRLSIKDLLVWA